MSTQEATINGEAIRLFTITDEHNQVNSVVPIRWCISRETAEALQDKEIEDPQLLLVVSKNGREMDRYVVPLTDMMRYVQFRSPGENIVHATIVWQMNDSYKPKKVLTARRDNGVYRTVVISTRRPNNERISSQLDKLRSELHEAFSEKKKSGIRTKMDQLRSEKADYLDEEEETLIRDDFDSVNQLGEEAQLGIMVPEQMFAKKPPAWMTWLGNRYKWNGTARDECDLRRRALVTAITAPFAIVFLAALGVVLGCIIVGWTLVNLVTMIPLLLFGMRGMSWRLVAPFPDESNPEVIWKARKWSLWCYKATKDSKGVTYEARAPFFFVFNPGTIVVAAGFGVFIGWLYESSLFEGAAIALAWLFAASVIVAISASGPAKNWFAVRRKLREKAEEEALSHELELLACTSQSREVSLRALPKERRTITLRFQALKASVCKPFAR